MTSSRKGSLSPLSKGGSLKKFSLPTANEQVIFLIGLISGIVFAIASVVIELSTRNTTDRYGLYAFVGDFLRELATVAFTITIFEFLKDIYLRQQEEDKRVSLINDVARRIKRTLGEKNNLASAGIVDVITPFNVRTLESIINKELNRGDCLYCHDGTISEILVVRELIIEKALENVRFRFMSLAPFCMNARRRAQEVYPGKTNQSNLLSQYQEFNEIIEGIRSDIRDRAQTRLKNELNLACLEEEHQNEVNQYVDCVQARYFRSLLSIPFYLLEKSSSNSADPKKVNLEPELVKAWTGFYLSTFSSQFIFIKWKPNDSEQDQSGQFPDMIGSLKKYWDFKWDKAYDEYLKSALWVGTWDYSCTDKAVSESVIYKGKSIIREEFGRFVATCTRTQTCKTATECDFNNIVWNSDDSNVIHKFQKGKDNCLFLALSYIPDKATRVLSSISDDLSLKCVKCFVQLKAESINKLSGHYYVAFADEAQKNELMGMFPSLSGEISLERAKELQKEQSDPLGIKNNSVRT